MIDNLLQDFYMRKINPGWSKREPTEILSEYYNNLLKNPTRKNINRIFDEIQMHHVPRLTKLRTFDILWWSYLKSDRLRSTYGIKWSSVNA